MSRLLQLSQHRQIQKYLVELDEAMLYHVDLMQKLHQLILQKNTEISEATLSMFANRPFHGIISHLKHLNILSENQIDHLGQSYEDYYQQITTIINLIKSKTDIESGHYEGLSYALQQLLTHIRLSKSQMQSSLYQYDLTTGLFNHHKLEEILYREHAKFLRNTENYSLCICDLDMKEDLKRRFTPSEMEELYASLAENFVANLRPYDYIFREASGCFGLLLPDTELDDATKAVGRIRNILKEKYFVIIQKKHVSFTLSFGIVQSHAKLTSDKLLIKAFNAFKSAQLRGDCITKES